MLPIVLPAKHGTTTLIIEDYHKQQLHTGVQEMIAGIRSDLLRNSMKQVIRRCLICCKTKPTNETYNMGLLPYNRFEPSRSFLNSGVAFCESFNVREHNERKSKA